MKARENPFVTARLHALPYQFPPALGWTWLLKRLAEMNYRGALVGPEGSGKTTLLLELKTQLACGELVPVYLRLDSEHRHLSEQVCEQVLSRLTSQQILLLDGAEQLSRRDWQRVLRQSQNGGGLIITTHGPRLLPTVMNCETSLELFRNLVQQLLPNEYSKNSLPLSEVFQQHRGNVRLALLALYDRFAVF